MSRETPIRLEPGEAIYTKEALEYLQSKLGKERGAGLVYMSWRKVTLKDAHRFVKLIKKQDREKARMKQSVALAQV